MNMEHNHGGLEDYSSFQNGWFVGSMLIFQGVDGVFFSARPACPQLPEGPAKGVVALGAEGVGAFGAGEWAFGAGEGIAWQIWRPTIWASHIWPPSQLEPV